MRIDAFAPNASFAIAENCRDVAVAENNVNAGQLSQVLHFILFIEVL